MPNVDFASGSASSSGEDYSSYEYQHAVVQLGRTGNGSLNPNIKGGTTIEPLDGAQKLDNNEVAELIYLRVQAQIEYELETDEQNVASATELRGFVGINVPIKNSSFIQSNPNQLDFEFFDTDGGEEFANVATLTNERYLDQFMTRGNPAFVRTSGGGGGEGSIGYDQDYTYRQLVGRGPVFDANDDLTVGAVLNISDSKITESGQIRLSMIWDVAETSDAGRAFSVPSGM